MIYSDNDINNNHDNWSYDNNNEMMTIMRILVCKFFEH